MHRHHWRPAVTRVLPEFFVSSDLATRVSHLTHDLTVVGALLAYDRYSTAENLATSAPLMIRAYISHALCATLRLVKVVDKLPFIFLAADDTFLGTQEPRRYHIHARADLLRRSVQLLILPSHVCEPSKLRHRATTWVKRLCLALILLRMQEHGFETHRLALESSVLNVVVRRGFVHEVLD